MDSVGSWNALETFALMIPDGETASVKFDYKNIPLNFEINFMKDLEVKEPNVKIERVPESLKFIFINWDNGLGSSLSEVSRIATFKDNTDLGILAVHWKIGNINRLDIKFLVKADQNG